MSTLLGCLIVSQREMIVLDTYHTNERASLSDKLRLDTSNRFDGDEEICLENDSFSRVIVTKNFDEKS